MRKTFMVFCLLLILCFTPTWSQAEPILDQTNTDVGMYNWQGTAFNDSLIDLSIAYAQTFTVGLSGTLASIETELAGMFFEPMPPGDFNFDILTTNASGAPIFSSIATITRPISTLQTEFSWVEFDLRSFNIPVTPGDVLAFALSIPQPVMMDGTALGVSVTGTLDQSSTVYPRGQAYMSWSGGEWMSMTSIVPEQSEIDMTFKTYVETTPIPEPTTMLLFGAGLVGLAGFGRKKFKK